MSADFLNQLAEKVKTMPSGFRENAQSVIDQLSSGMQQWKQQHPGGELGVGVIPAERKEFRLEKDWHVMHYALNCTAMGGKGPLADVILSPNRIHWSDRDEPLGYLPPERVAAVAASLNMVNPAELLSKLNMEDALAKKIYLAHTLSDLNGWGYFPDFFESFREFYQDAARNGNAMLMSMGDILEFAR